MKLRQTMWIVGYLLLASVAFAEAPREYPVNRGPNELEVLGTSNGGMIVSGFENPQAASGAHRMLLVGVRLSAGILSFYGENASYVGYGNPGTDVDLGPVLKITLNQIFEIDPGLAFGYRFHRYNASSYSLSMEEYMLKIPVALHAYVYNGLFVGAGIQGAVSLHSKNKATSYGWPVTFKSNNPEFGFLVDLGYTIYHFSIDARLYMAVTDYSDNDVIGEWQGLVYHPFTASLGVSYFF